MPARTTTFDFFCAATSHPKDPPTPPSLTLTTPQNFLQSKQIHSQPTNPMQSTGLISTNAKNTKAKSKVKANQWEKTEANRERERREWSKGKTPQNAAKELPQSRSWTPPRGRSDGNCKKTSITITKRKKNTHRENVEKNLICLRGWMVLYGATTLSAFQLLLLNICWGLLICLPV